MNQNVMNWRNQKGLPTDMKQELLAALLSELKGE